jgi:cell division protease FtsH
VNEAALLAARQDKDVVSMVDFEMAKDKVLMGTERRSMVISDQEKKTTAWHEAGHALVAKLLAGQRPGAQGHDHPARPGPRRHQQLPEGRPLTMSRDRRRRRGSRCSWAAASPRRSCSAEFTTGAGNDIKQASNLARRMVTEFGMSEKRSARLLRRERGPALPRPRLRRPQRDYSEQTANQIDDEVRAHTSSTSGASPRGLVATRTARATRT